MKLKTSFYITFIFLSLLLAIDAKSQHRLTVGFDWQQTDDAFNHGMIFGGANLTLGYGYSNYYEDSKLDIESKLKFGFSESHGVYGFNVGLQPIKLFYGIKSKYKGNLDLYYGLEFKYDYLVALYPDLQMGHDFWMSSFQFAPALHGDYMFDRDKLSIRISMSALGLYSRPDKKKDEYNFSLGFGDILSDLNSNWTLGSFNLATDLNASVEYVFDKEQPDYSISYDFRYMLYFKEPKYRHLYHGLSFNYYMGDK